MKHFFTIQKQMSKKRSVTLTEISNVRDHQSNLPLILVFFPSPVLFYRLNDVIVSNILCDNFQMLLCRHQHIRMVKSEPSSICIKFEGFFFIVIFFLCVQNEYITENGQTMLQSQIKCFKIVNAKLVHFCFSSSIFSPPTLKIAKNN